MGCSYYWALCCFENPRSNLQRKYCSTSVPSWGMLLPLPRARQREQLPYSLPGAIQGFGAFNPGTAWSSASRGCWLLIVQHRCPRRPGGAPFHRRLHGREAAASQPAQSVSEPPQHLTPRLFPDVWHQLKPSSASPRILNTEVLIFKCWRSMRSANGERQGNTNLLQSIKPQNAVFNRQYSHSKERRKA